MEGEAFEVFGFWKGGDNRMIESLGVTVKEAQSAFAIYGGALDAFEKEFASGVVRAAEGGEDSAGV